jgi:long-chain fatty acid transport protein
VNQNGALPANPGVPGTIPPNADVPHQFKDVFGVRLGGDYNVLPDKLALRAGAFLETSAASVQFQNIDFMSGRRIGFALGGTYRIHLSEEPKANAVELSFGYGHMFVSDLSNTNPSAPGLLALQGTVPYHTAWAANLGTISNSLNVFNVGASYRF